MEPVTKPYNELDVDRELWDLLDLAHDDELQAVHDILYGESGIVYPACAAMLQAGKLNLHRGTVLLFRCQPIEPSPEVHPQGQRASGHGAQGQGFHHAPHRVPLPFSCGVHG